MADQTALIESVPSRIFSIEDFKDFRLEYDTPELSYDAYKPLRAEEYRETHDCNVTDEELDARVEADLLAIEEAELEGLEAATLLFNSDEPSDDEQAEFEKKMNTASKQVPSDENKDGSTKQNRKPRKAKAVKAKAGSKKAQTITIYTEVMSTGGSRKDGIARLTSELGLSKAGASTYWQNVKSGKWA